MTLLLDASIFSSFGNDILISLVTALVSLVGGYIIIRERILKTELKLIGMTDYIDRKNELVENKMFALQEDIQEFKELNKETNKALADNTLAIRELKTVLDMLKSQLGVQGKNRLNKFDQD